LPAIPAGCLAKAIELPEERPLRQIGTLPRNLDSEIFGDHLLALGMKARFDEQPDGWIVWIYNEDQLVRAKAELEAYILQPDDPRFDEGARAAEEVRRNEARLEKEHRKNFREVTDQWGGLQARRRPLTMALVIVSVVVYLLQQSSLRPVVVTLLRFTTGHLDPERGLLNDGLDPILAGEVWRLVTPIFLHFSPLHILFNVWAVTVEGTMIEGCRGTFRLAVLVLVAAVLSNLGQHFYQEQADPGILHLFGGLSGVGYALFGYLWMKGQYEPEQGMILHPNTITTMLFWLVLCMTGLVGSIANAAHVVGLLVGVAFGALRF
jgi:GlpG protein